MKKIFLWLLIFIIVIIWWYYADLIPLIPVYNKQPLYEPLIFLKSHNKLRVIVTKNQWLLEKRWNEGYFEMYAESSETDEHTQEHIQPKIFSVPYIDPDSFQFYPLHKYNLQDIVTDQNNVYVSNPWNWQFEIDKDDIIMQLDFDRDGLTFINKNFIRNKEAIGFLWAWIVKDWWMRKLEQVRPISWSVLEVEKIISCEDSLNTQDQQDFMKESRRYLIVGDKILVVSSKNTSWYTLKVIENADTDNFSLFSCRFDIMYSTDGQKIRYEDQEIVWVDVDTFELDEINSDIAKDKNNTYEKWEIIEDNSLNNE